MRTSIIEAKEKIQSGANWNGILYCKRANKSSFNIAIYLDGNYEYLERVSVEDLDSSKEEIMNFFNDANTQSKLVNSNLGFMVKASCYDVAQSMGFDAIENL